MLARRISWMTAGWLLCAAPAYANVIWPAVILEQRLFAWWVIGFGLAVEYLFLRAATPFSVRTSLLAVVAMNTVSMVLGVVLVPVAGIVLEIFPGWIIHAVLNVGTFNPVTWVLTCIVAALINAVLEMVAVARIFHYRTGRRFFLGLWLANVITVGLAFLSLIFVP